MAVIGKIIKTAINLSELLTTDQEGKKSQQSLLLYLLEQAKETDFGKKYAFQTILKDDDPARRFASTVPYYDYDAMRIWWDRILEGKENITWPGIPDYMALSSGTTGSDSKRIPVTNDMLEAIRQTGLHQIKSLSNIDLPASFFEKEILMLGSSTDLIKNGRFLEGEISGISASNLPFWFEGYYKPGKKIAQIQDWDQRVEKIALAAPHWDIGALSGIPSWIELMLKKVIDVHGLKNIHEIWPNLQVYTSGGVAFEPYIKSFDRLLARPIIVLDTYLASEGFLAYQAQADRMDMTLSLESGIYFEFVPFKPEYVTDTGSVTENAPSVTFKNTQEGKEYILIISTVSGAWRYVIGDTIKITNKENAEIRITGRTKHFLNVVGSQLSVTKMNDTMRHLEDVFRIELPEFTVSAIELQEGRYYHSWHLGVSGNGQASENELAAELDKYLKGINKNYEVARNRALEAPRVNMIAVGCFYQFTERLKKKGGQVKFKRLMNPAEYSEWTAYLEKDQATFSAD